MSSITRNDDLVTKDHFDARLAEMNAKIDTGLAAVNARIDIGFAQADAKLERSLRNQMI